METKKRVRILHDSSPSNPFTEWDCEPPLMWKSGRSGGEDYSNGDIRDFIRDEACAKFAEYKEELCRITGVDLEDFEESEEDQILDAICDAIVPHDMDLLVELCGLLDIEHESYTSTGYSQSDWADVLIVLTDDFFKTTGCERENSQSILTGTAKLFNDYMWGDVFGFIIEECKVYKRVLASEFDAGNFEDVEEEEEWEEIDSCWGFYGDNFMENGMSDYVPKELHSQLENFDYNDIEY